MDCIEGMANVLPPKCVDIIVTSPPYNIGAKYSMYKDNLRYTDYLKWIYQFGKICGRVLKDTGSVFFNVGDTFSNQFKAFETAKQISKTLKLQNTIHWIKAISITDHNISAGHFKPVNSERLLNNCHEYIFHFTKSNDVKLDKLSIGVPYADKSNITRWKQSIKKGDRRDRGNVWFIPYKTVHTQKEHPAAFPAELPEMCIKLHGYNKHTVVLDPFVGCGTTIAVAKQLGCQFIGFEIDPNYLEISKKKVGITSTSL